MNDIIRLDPDRSDQPVPVLPAPRLPGAGVSIRTAVLGDFPFIDDLQKRHSKAVGFMFAGAIKGHLVKGNVLVAEATGDVRCSMADVRQGSCPETGSPHIEHRASNMPVGYLIGVDRYLKRDELGIIYQINVVPGSQRGLVAANLLKEKFERSAYGCRLYCCWCAQDLEANRFWEAMGFVPLAFRTGGGRRKGYDEQGNFRGRMHIFWQKRIRANDDFPYWFPSQTGAGAIGEDRLVLPIPPGSHWSDAKPIVLPQSSASGEEALLLEAKVDRLTKAKKAAKKTSRAGDTADKPKKNPGAGVKGVAAG